MALAFPSSPSVGDEFSGGGFTWTWNGTSWSKLSASGGDAAQLGFDLVIGTSGDTTFELAALQSAGEYTINSQLSDTTYDIYFINEDDQNVGYSTTGKITATDTFKKIVVYGGENNDILNFSFGYVSEPSGQGNINGGAAPFITGISPNNLPNDDDIMTITGGNFANDVEVILIGSSGTEYAPKTTVRSSSTQLTVTRPNSLLSSDGPYDVKVINPGITPAVRKPNQLTNAMYAGSGVTWSTSSVLLPFTPSVAHSRTLVASDPDSSAISYAIIDGSLPNGMSLNGSTGEISGTSTDVVEATFTVRATDAGGNFSDRQFSLPPVVSATGGQITADVDGYRYHAFTSSGTFNVARGGAVEIVTVAGGGAGRNSGNSYNSGGGAGGFLISSTSLSSEPYTLTVGGAGSNTTFGSISELTAYAGGPGTDSTGGGASGGSGGGNTYGPGGGGTAGQGNNGGTTGSTAWNSGVYAGGGGGGRGGGGGGGYRFPGTNVVTGGYGGSGINYTTWGDALGVGHLVSGNRYFAAGGNASPNTQAQPSGYGANTGGGGNQKSSGHSGIIMIRYPI